MDTSVISTKTFSPEPTKQRDNPSFAGRKLSCSSSKQPIFLVFERRRNQQEHIEGHQQRSRR